jgi:hypothetical protein
MTAMIGNTSAHGPYPSALAGYATVHAALDAAERVDRYGRGLLLAPAIGVIGRVLTVAGARASSVSPPQGAAGDRPDYRSSRRSPYRPDVRK